MRLGRQRYESRYLAIKYFYEEKQWNINWMCRQLDISRAALLAENLVPYPIAENKRIYAYKAKWCA